MALPSFVKKSLRIVRKLLPAPLTRKLSIASGRRRLSDVATIACDTTPLPDFKRVTFAQWFEDDEVAEAWRTVEQAIDELGVAEQRGGVNPGDRRAIYTLVRQW